MTPFEATMIAEGAFDMVDATTLDEFESVEEAQIAAFQELINTGMAWQLQGFFGRTAAALIDAGHCTRPE